jgi:hypothetical protein
MIKGLFFTAALLMPSLAYAGNPSANLSVQVVPAGMQVAPAGAQAAGYTTLAFHSDFTQPFYTNLSNWLDCAGATSPQWWIAGGNGHSPPPCARISMINDGGAQVMDMQFTAADAADLGTVLTPINALVNRYTQGVDFPNGAYWQVTFRVLPNGLNNNPYGNLIAAWWTWSDTGQTASSTAFQERDFPEIYTTGCCHNDVITHGYWAPSGQNQILLAGFGAPEYPIDPTIYHTFAARVTQDGSTNLAICFYIDNALQNCGDMISSGNTGATAITSSQLNQRNYPVLQLGPINSTPVAATMDLLVKDVQIWTCAGWQGPLNQPGYPCNGPVLTGAP